MKPRHDRFPRPGANLHDQSGRPAAVCPKCAAPLAAKPGFRPSSLKCPKCGAAVGQP